MECPDPPAERHHLIRLPAGAKGIRTAGPSRERVGLSGGTESAGGASLRSRPIPVTQTNLGASSRKRRSLGQHSGCLRLTYLKRPCPSRRSACAISVALQSLIKI